jgi:hypothetical protein
MSDPYGNLYFSTRIELVGVTCMVGMVVRFMGIDIIVDEDIGCSIS